MHDLWQYIILQLNVVPIPVYKGLFALFCISTIVLLAVNRKKAARNIVWLLFFEFVFFVLGMTGYVSVWRVGNQKVLHEIILNVALFVPLGFLWGIQSSKWPKRWQWLSAMILGISLSVVIELLQYCFKKGCVEVDDVIHNTLGCLVGFVLWRGCAKWFFGSKSYTNLF